MTGGLDDVRRADEPGDEPGRGALVDVFGIADLFDLALRHHRDAVAHHERLFLVVRDVDERDADLALDAHELELHLLAELEVERAERFVEQEHGRLVDQRAGERDPLLLAARELGGPALVVAVELHEVEVALDPVADLGLRDLLAPQTERDVVGDGQVREQRVRLEDGVDVALERRDADDVAAASASTRPSSGSSNPAIMRSEVVLPQPDGPSIEKNSPRVDLDRDVVDRDHVAEALRHAVEADLDWAFVVGHSPPPARVDCRARSQMPRPCCNRHRSTALGARTAKFVAESSIGNRLGNAKTSLRPVRASDW